jgi:carbamoyltransferase
MNILGIGNLDNSSAALLVDGRLAAACEEERFTRQKHFRGFPRQSVAYCLESAGLGMNDVDHVAVGWVPLRGIVHRVATTLGAALKDRRFGHRVSRGNDYFAVIKEQLALRGLLEKAFDAKKKVPIHYVNHHMAHLACSYFLSGWDNAAALSIDGCGEYQTCVMGKFENARFVKLKEIKYPNSLGHIYGVFTSFLGFKPNSGEGKVMGLAAYGKPVYLDDIRSFVFFDEKKIGLSFDPAYIDYAGALQRWFPRSFTAVFGPPRQPEGPVGQVHKDIAASIQAFTEEVMVGLSLYLARQTGCRSLCLSGGVALNCVANAKIKEQTPFERIYVPSAPSDAGASLGAALYLYSRLTGESPKTADACAFLGPGFSREELAEAVKRSGMTYREVENPARTAAEFLAEGKIIGWFQERMEFGPRALGARSILAPPFPGEMKDIINRRVKFRENFRPFAPVILAEEAERWFDHYCPSPNMSFALAVKPGQRDKIPAIVHVNGRARLQTVDKKDNPLLYEVLEHFRDLTGIPVFMNTSFNRRGEPIVCTPGDALACFEHTGMDALFLGGLVVSKQD